MLYVNYSSVKLGRKTKPETRKHGKNIGHSSCPQEGKRRKEARSCGYNLRGKVLKSDDPGFKSCLCFVIKCMSERLGAPSVKCLTVDLISGLNLKVLSSSSV